MEELESTALLSGDSTIYEEPRPASTSRASRYSSIQQSYMDEDIADAGLIDENRGFVFASFQEDHFQVDYDPLTLLQAQVFIEDAAYYRSIQHKVDARSLRLYRFYYARFVRWVLNANILLIHALAFFEWPSSLTWTSDIKTPSKRLYLPCGVTEGIEGVCLILFIFDLAAKMFFIGKRHASHSRWLIAYFIVLLISTTDWLVSVSLGCTEVFRIRRLFRPFFLLQNSSLMKKCVKSVKSTLPDIASVLLLLGFHIFIFTLLGMLLFPKPNEGEGWLYFRTLQDSFMNLLVLLTTANNPDVMIPAYRENRLYAIYFIVFLIIGLYCFMSMLTAVIYNEFRGYFLNSMQTSLFRRRLAIRAAFEVLRMRQAEIINESSGLVTESSAVPAKILRIVMMKCNIPREVKDKIIEELKGRMGCMLDASNFGEVMLYLDQDRHKSEKPQVVWVENSFLHRVQCIVAHRYFAYVGTFIALANVICITVEVVQNEDRTVISKDSILLYIDLCFIAFYVIEQSLKLWALGWTLYMFQISNFFDGLVTIILVIVEVIFLGFPQSKSGTELPDLSLLDLVRLVNMLIIIRLLRIIPQIKMMSLVANTLLDLVRNMQSFLGILFVIYYTFAILGMQLFNGAIKYNHSSNLTNASTSYKCGTYQQLDYWPNNFDDFAASLVVLWDVMVVNNWFVFLHAYSEATSKWSQLYFIAWWMVSVIVVLNLFIALILDNFIMRWDRNYQIQTDDRSLTFDVRNYGFQSMSVHDMFRNNLREPDEGELITELQQHGHLNII